MATNGYPHLVFVQPDPGLDKETLAALLDRTFPGSTVEDKPLRLDLDRGGYVFSFWFEDAEGVAERYATYLPEGGRRRWLSRCETMIDLHGAADPHGHHADDARRIVEAMLALDGAAVFSEATKRFVGMDYGDVPSETVPASDLRPGPASEVAPAPASAPQPPLQDEPIVPAQPAAPEPQPTLATEPVVPAGSSSLESLAQTPASEPAAEPRPAAQPEPTGGSDAARAKPGLFKRVFGRR